MSVINTNTAANIAASAVKRNELDMSRAMERLSTGARINSAKDDAAGLAISDRMGSQVRGLNMAVRNANDAISMIQTIEGATKEISSMLSRMRELAVQAASGTYTATDRTALDLEFGALMDEISRVAKNTEWNGGKVLIGATNNDYNANDPVLTSNIQLGAGASQTMVLTFRSWVPTVAYDSDQSTAGGTGADGLDQNDLSAYSNSGSSAESAANSSALFWSNSGTVTRIDITSVGNASQKKQKRNYEAKSDPNL
jgi:flagellin